MKEVAARIKFVMGVRDTLGRANGEATLFSHWEMPGRGREREKEKRESQRESCSLVHRATDTHL